MTTNIHYLIAAMAVLLVVLWQYSRQRQMDDRNSLMFRRLLRVVSLDVAAELVSTGFILYAPYSFNVCRMLSNTVFYLFQALLPLLLLYYVCTLCTSRVIAPSTVLRMGIPTIALVFVILTNPFTEIQLRRVCRFLCENPALRASIANVKINLSPLDLIQSESGSHLVRILGEYGLPCSCFQFEITETVATEYSASLTRVAESLQAAGIGLCLDDFGSGYANLNTVMQLPFSVIKLDRSLLFHICTDKNAALFYQSIVSAFCRLGYRIVAEGVETQEEMELLRSWNVDMIQGYYFSRPLPPDDLLRLLTGSAETQAENQA